MSEYDLEALAGPLEFYSRCNHNKSILPVACYIDDILRRVYNIAEFRQMIFEGELKKYLVTP